MPTPVYDATPSNPWCGQAVVGAKYHMDVVNAIRATVPLDDDQARRFPVTLVLEPDNPHSASRKAMSVRWQDRVLGYIPDDETAQYFPELARLAASGYDLGTKARLWVSSDSDRYEDPNSRPGIKLDIAMYDPGRILPLNDPPLEGWALIPKGSSIQVTKENEHYDVLQRYVTKSGKTRLLATLHKVMRGVQTSWFGVEVRVDGECIGELTKGSSGKLIPIIDYYSSLGLTSVCYATLVGSALAAEVTLNVRPAHEIDDSLLTDPPIAPLPRLVPLQSDPLGYIIPPRWTPSAADVQAPAHPTTTYYPQAPQYSPTQQQPPVQLQQRVTTSPDPLGDALLNEYYQMVAHPTTMNQAPTFTPPSQPVNVYAPTPQMAHPGMVVQQKDFTTYFLLAVLGGWLGLHHYYMGNYGKGILYALTGGLSCIGWFIDVICSKNNFNAMMMQKTIPPQNYW